MTHFPNETIGNTGVLFYRHLHFRHLLYCHLPVARICLQIATGLMPDMEILPKGTPGERARCLVPEGQMSPGIATWLSLGMDNHLPIETIGNTEV